jgi:hypothetical protein
MFNSDFKYSQQQCHGFPKFRTKDGNASQGAMITSIYYLPICLGRIMPKKTRTNLFTPI